MKRLTVVLACAAVLVAGCAHNSAKSPPPSTTTTAPAPPSSTVHVVVQPTTADGGVALGPKPAGLVLEAVVQNTTVAHDDAVRGYLRVVNTNPKGAPDIQVHFRPGCNVRLTLYSGGKEMAHSDAACTANDADYAIRSGETRISGFGNGLVLPSGASPAPGVYDLGVTLEESPNPWLAPLVTLTLT